MRLPYGLPICIQRIFARAVRGAEFANLFTCRTWDPKGAFCTVNSTGIYPLVSTRHFNIRSVVRRSILGGRQMEHGWTRKPAWRKATPFVRTWRNQYSEAFTTRNFSVEIVGNTSVYPSESSKYQRIRAMIDQIRSVFRGYPEETRVRF